MRAPSPLRALDAANHFTSTPVVSSVAFVDNSIVLGVSGGIAAYKSAIVASLLVQAGATVDVVMTEAATRFVQPLTFNAITHRPVHVDIFEQITELSPGHVGLARNTDLLVVAPATARMIAALALGLSDDLLALVALSTRAPILIAPAMEDHMYNHPATTANIETLAARGVTFVGPEHGHLASGLVGVGRMASPEEIVGAAQRLLRRTSTLAGRKIVVTAGGTREPLDPVRYLGNRSSGRMGFALAKMAVDLGAEVVLIAGPSELTPPPQTRLVAVETTAQMQRAVEAETLDADALIMAAAVADYRPAEFSHQKRKKQAGQATYTLELVANPDILASLDRPHLLKVGFAAETENLVENALRKLRSKDLAIIVANDALTSIGTTESQATLLFQDGSVVELPRLAKDDVAARIMEAVASLLNSDRRGPG